MILNFLTLQGQPPLYGASEYGSVEIVKLLIDRDANVNLPTQDVRSIIKLMYSQYNYDVYT